MTRLVVFLLAVVTAGCLTRNAAEPRFFRPDSTLLRDTPGDAEAAPPRGVTLIRVRSVEAESFLRERIVWRASAVEYGAYEQRRWRESPASYVDRALQAAFRRTGRIRVTDDYRVPVLRVDVLAFDEVLAPAHTALVDASVMLRDKTGRVLLERTFSATAPIADDDPTTMARAMGHALDTVATEIADAVTVASAPRK